MSIYEDFFLNNCLPGMLGTEVIHQQSTCSLFQIKQAVRDSSPSEKNYDRFYFPDYK